MHTLQSAIGFNTSNTKGLIAVHHDQEHLTHENRHIHNIIHSNQNKAMKYAHEGAKSDPRLKVSEFQSFNRSGNQIPIFNHKQSIKIQPKNYIPIQNFFATSEQESRQIVKQTYYNKIVEEKSIKDYSHYDGYQQQKRLTSSMNSPSNSSQIN